MSLPYGLEKKDLKPGSIKVLLSALAAVLRGGVFSCNCCSCLQSMNPSKLQVFEQGRNTKSQYEKQREEQEMKKKRDEVEAARVYEEFVASFEESEDAGTKAFIRGDTIVPKGRAAAACLSPSCPRMLKFLQIRGGAAQPRRPVSQARSTARGQRRRLRHKQRPERCGNSTCVVQPAC